MMKKLLLVLFITFGFANEFGIGSIKGNTITIQSASTIWFLREQKLVNTEKAPAAMRVLRGKVCAEPKLKRAVENGIVLEYIFIGKNNKAVAMKIDSCK